VKVMHLTDMNDVCAPIRFVGTKRRKTNQPSTTRSAALKLEE